MSRIARYVKCTVALHLQLSFAVDTAFLRAVGTIGKCILGVFLDTQLDALLVINVDGCSAGVSQRETGQLYGTLIATVECKRTV